MIFRYGDMIKNIHKDPKSVYFFTANGVVDKWGLLVMGAGSAKAFRDRVMSPYDRRALSKYIIKNGQEIAGTYRYGLALIPGTRFGAFQSKLHFRHPARIDVIHQGCVMLGWLANQHPNTWFHIPYPGIGYGGLSPAQVEPLLEPLPDNVRVWRYA